jgi:membrane protease YdiL (CAAX protease family)
MLDLTEMVLTGSFAAAFGLFLVGALVKRGRGAANRVLGDAVGWGPPELPVGRVAVWFYRPLDLVGAGLVFGMFGVLVLGSARPAEAAAPVLGFVTMLVNIALQFVLAGGLAIGVVRRVGWVTWLGLRWSGWAWVLVIAPGAVLFMWAVFGALMGCGYMEWMESLGVETVQDAVKVLQKSEDPLILGLMAFAAVVAAPLCEEMVFRGYMYPVLKKYSGRWAAAVCSSLVFASAHGDLTALLPLFIFGGVLVVLYEMTGSLWAPVAAHFCFNSATVVTQMAARYFNISLDAVP